MGSYFSYLYFAKYKLLGYRYITLIAFVSITLYLLVFYFIIDYNLPKEMLFLPILLRSFGYVLLSICLITSLTRLPFNIFFNGIAVNGFVGAGLAGVFGSAVLVRLFKITFNKNIMLISSHIDNSYADVNINNIFMLVKDQALIVSLKELYGWLSFISIIILFLIILIKIDINPRSVILPTYKAIRRFYARIT